MEGVLGESIYSGLLGRAHSAMILPPKHLPIPLDYASQLGLPKAITDYLE